MEEILERIIEIVEETLDVENVTERSHMQDDLGISSLDFYELLTNLEMEFSIRIPEKVLAEVDTVMDIASEVKRIMEK